MVRRSHTSPPRWGVALALVLLLFLALQAPAWGGGIDDPGGWGGTCAAVGCESEDPPQGGVDVPGWVRWVIGGTWFVY